MKPQCAHGGQSTPLWGLFSPSTEGLLRIESGVGGAKDFYKAPKYLGGLPNSFFSI